MLSKFKDPVFILSLLATVIGTTTAVDVFAAIALLCSLAVAAVHSRAGRAPAAPAAGEQATCR